MISGNLAFEMGWWGANQSYSSIEISISLRNGSGKGSGKGLGNGLGNDSVIGWNLAFWMGWWGVHQSDSSIEISISSGKVFGERFGSSARLFCLYEKYSLDEMEETLQCLVFIFQERQKPTT